MADFAAPYYPDYHDAHANVSAVVEALSIQPASRDSALTYQVESPALTRTSIKRIPDGSDRQEAMQLAIGHTLMSRCSRGAFVAEPMK